MVEREEKVERNKNVANSTNTLENNPKRAQTDEALACVVVMFARCEEMANTIIYHSNRDRKRNSWVGSKFLGAVEDRENYEDSD